tara:strand:- start:44 stop:355 length:312 start_codon:yes stop_codon:yes gene_type:complete
MNGYLIMTAIQELSNKQFQGSVIGNTLDGIDWNGMEPIADDVITAKVEEIKNRDAHIVPRMKAYPSIADQLDMQYHDQINGTTTWKDTIAKVKTDNPKAEGNE